MNKNAFWNRVKAQIKLQKTKQEWAAEKAGINAGTIKQMIHFNRLPNVEQGQKMAAALETTVEYLVTGSPPAGIAPETLAIARKIAGLSLQDKDEILALVEYKLERAAQDASGAKKAEGKAG